MEFVCVGGFWAGPGSEGEQHIESTVLNKFLKQRQFFCEDVKMWECIVAAKSDFPNIGTAAGSKYRMLYVCTA